jgi:hypothetical protein
MSQKIDLPEICPDCGAHLEDDESYHTLGIQYCSGIVIEVNNNGTVTLDDLDGGDLTVNPYQIFCGGCECVLWKKTIIINEEQFFVEKGEE